MGVLALRDSRVERDAALVFLLLGAVLLGWEIYARLTRKTLVLHPGKVEVFRRDVLLGSFDPAQARYYGWISKVRPLLVGVLLSGLPVLVGSTTSGWLRAAMMIAGLASVAAMIHDFRTHWTIACSTWTLTPTKADVIAIFGSWPGDRMDARMLQFSLLVGWAFAILAVTIVAIAIYLEMYGLLWLAAAVGGISAWALTSWAHYRPR